MKAMRETTVLEPEADAEGSSVPAIEEPRRCAEGRGRSLILATAISVAAAVLATVLAIVVSSRRQHSR
jgi:hypothetical protein